MQKIQLTIANNFISSIDNDEEHEIYSKNNNIKIMIKNYAENLKIEIKIT